jgi:hypothetical protein
MSLGDIASLVHFRELHFLPRVIFFLGAVFLIGSFFVKSFTLGILGVAVIFSGSALNLVINTLLGIGHCLQDKATGFPFALFWQAILASVLALGTMWSVYFFYRHGVLPTFLRPLSAKECVGTDWR